MSAVFLNAFVEYFSQFIPLSEEEESAIKESTQILTFEKGTVLLQEGQISRECYFILDGCMRKYHVKDGEEKTTNFYTEEQWVISLSSFMNGTPADHYFSCIEESTVVIGKQEPADDLYQRFPKFETISRSIVEKDFADQQKLMASYITDTPEQRYLNLMNNRPDLLQRVPQYQLASFIGVKPESLSRIRKRILDRNSPGNSKN